MGGGPAGEAADGRGRNRVAGRPAGGRAGRLAPGAPEWRRRRVPARRARGDRPGEGGGRRFLDAHRLATARGLRLRVGRRAGRPASAHGGDARRHGSPARCRGAALRAGIHFAERSVVGRDGTAVEPRRPGREGAAAQRSRRRLSGGAGPLPHASSGGSNRAQARPAVLDLPAGAMMARALPRSRLDNLIPSLVEAQALVALVPATGDLEWAAAAAWDVARAAARQGQRRVALVDLWVEEPKLHEVVRLTPTEGIVDAFEYGVSLTKAAHEIDHVFFIAAGAYTTHAGDLFGNPRWKKLHGGFRVEGALLLLYLSAGGLARLSATPDGLIVLSPDGFEPESSIGLGITAAVQRGTPLLGVVRERWAPAAPTLPEPLPRQARRSRPTPLPQPIPDSPLPRHSPRSRRRARPLVVVATLAAGVAGSWALLAIGAEQRSRRLLVSPPAPAPAPPAVRPRAFIAEADPLPWTVQLAAYGRLENALAVADRLLAEGVPAFVTPIALQGPAGSAVWYRVL